MCLNDQSPDHDQALWKDPIVEEVREAGRKIFEEAGGTLEGYFKHLRKAQEKYRDRLVNKIERVPEPGGTAI